MAAAPPRPPLAEEVQPELSVIEQMAREERGRQEPALPTVAPPEVSTLAPDLAEVVRLAKEEKARSRNPEFAQHLGRVGPEPAPPAVSWIPAPQRPVAKPRITDAQASALYQDFSKDIAPPRGGAGLALDEMLTLHPYLTSNKAQIEKRQREAKLGLELAKKNELSPERLAAFQLKLTDLNVAEKNYEDARQQYGRAVKTWRSAPAPPMPPVVSPKFKGHPAEEQLGEIDRQLDYLRRVGDQGGGELAPLQGRQVQALVDVHARFPEMGAELEREAANLQQHLDQLLPLVEARDRGELGERGTLSVNRAQTAAKKAAASLKARAVQLDRYQDRFQRLIGTYTKQPLHTGMNYPQEVKPNEPNWIEQKLKALGELGVGGYKLSSILNPAYNASEKFTQEYQQAINLAMLQGKYPPLPALTGTPEQKARQIAEKNQALTWLLEEQHKNGPAVLGPSGTVVNPAQMIDWKRHAGVAKRFTPWQKSLLPILRQQLAAVEAADVKANLPGKIAEDIGIFGASMLGAGAANRFVLKPMLKGMERWLVAPAFHALTGEAAGLSVRAQQLMATGAMTKRFLAQTVPHAAAGLAGGAAGGGLASLGLTAVETGDPVAALKSVPRAMLEGGVIGLVLAGTPAAIRSAWRDNIFSKHWDPARGNAFIEEFGARAQKKGNLSASERLNLQADLERIGRAAMIRKPGLVARFQERWGPVVTGEATKPPGGRVKPQPTDVVPMPQETPAPSSAWPRLLLPDGSTVDPRSAGQAVLQEATAAAQVAGDAEGAARGQQWLAFYQAYAREQHQPIPPGAAQQYLVEWMDPKNPDYRDYSMLKGEAEALRQAEPGLAAALDAAALELQREFTHQFSRRVTLQGGGVPGEMSLPPPGVSAWRQLSPSEQAQLAHPAQRALLKQDIINSRRVLNPEAVGLSASERKAGPDELRRIAELSFGQAQDWYAQNEAHVLDRSGATSLSGQDPMEQAARLAALDGSVSVPSLVEALGMSPQAAQAAIAEMHRWAILGPPNATGSYPVEVDRPDLEALLSWRRAEVPEPGAHAVGGGTAVGTFPVEARGLAPAPPAGERPLTDIETHVKPAKPEKQAFEPKLPVKAPVVEKTQELPVEKTQELKPQPAAVKPQAKPVAVAERPEPAEGELVDGGLYRHTETGARLKITKVGDDYWFEVVDAGASTKLKQGERKKAYPAAILKQYVLDQRPVAEEKKPPEEPPPAAPAEKPPPPAPRAPPGGAAATDFEPGQVVTHKKSGTRYKVSNDGNWRLTPVDEDDSPTGAAFDVSPGQLKKSYQVAPEQSGGDLYPNVEPEPEPVIVPEPKPTPKAKPAARVVEKKGAKRASAKRAARVQPGDKPQPAVPEPAAGVPPKPQRGFKPTRQQPFLPRAPVGEGLPKGEPPAVKPASTPTPLMVQPPRVTRVGAAPAVKPERPKPAAIPNPFAEQQKEATRQAVTGQTEKPVEVPKAPRTVAEVERDLKAAYLKQQQAARKLEALEDQLGPKASEDTRVAVLHEAREKARQEVERLGVELREVAPKPEPSKEATKHKEKAKPAATEVKPKAKAVAPEAKPSERDITAEQLEAISAREERLRVEAGPPAGAKKPWHSPTEEPKLNKYTGKYERSLRMDVTEAFRTGDLKTNWAIKEFEKLKGAARQDLLDRRPLLKALAEIRAADAAGTPVAAEDILDRLSKDWKQVGKWRLAEKMASGEIEHKPLPKVEAMSPRVKAATEAVATAKAESERLDLAYKRLMAKMQADWQGSGKQPPNYDARQADAAKAAVGAEEAYQAARQQLLAARAAEPVPAKGKRGAKPKPAGDADQGRKGGESPRQKPLWEMSLDELDQAKEWAKNAERELEESLFGKEGAARYRTLQRKANSSYDMAGADQAAREINQLEATLTPAEQQRLFGIGDEAIVTSEEVRDYQRALGGLDAGSAEELGDSLKYALTKVGQETDPLKMTYDEQLAYATLREGYRLAKIHGFDTGEVTKAAVKAAAKRWPGETGQALSEDAAFMLRRYLNDVTGMAEAPQGKALPTGEEGLEGRKGGEKEGPTGDFLSPTVKSEGFDKNVVPPPPVRRESAIVGLVKAATRQYASLPKGPEYASLKLRANRLMAATNTTKNRLALEVDHIVRGMSPKEQLTFWKAAITRDVAASLDRQYFDLGREEGIFVPDELVVLPPGWEVEDVARESENFERIAAANPKIAAALDANDALLGNLAESLADGAEAVTGRRPKMDRKHYFPHLVMAHMGQLPGMGVSQPLKAPTGAGYLKARSTFDRYLTNWAIAVQQVGAQMAHDAEKYDLFGYVQDTFDASPDLQAAVIAHHDATLIPFMEKLAAQVNASLPDTAEPKTPEEAFASLYHWRQAAAIQGLGKLAAAGVLEPGYNGKWEELIHALHENYEINQAAKELEEENYEPRYLPEKFARQLMGYAAWLLGQKRDTAGRKQSAMLFKGIAEKKKAIEAALGDEKLTVGKLASFFPEAFAPFQPDPGSWFYSGDSMPDYLAKQIREEGGEIRGDQLTRAVMRGERKPTLYLPPELVEFMHELGKPTGSGNVIDKNIQKAASYWKQYQLVAPWRIAGYNTRNLIGDTEFAWVGHPKIVFHAASVVPKLARYYFGGSRKVTTDMTGRKRLPGFELRGKKPLAPAGEVNFLQAWLDRGGEQTLSLEANQVGNMAALYDLAGQVADPTNLWEKHVPFAARQFNGYWKAARLTTSFRESILRLSAFEIYYKEMQRHWDANPHLPPEKRGKVAHWDQTASVPEHVMAIEVDPRNPAAGLLDRAHKLSNELMGAYDQVTELGQYMRQRWSPFWAWKEVNFKRNYQLWHNALSNPDTLLKAVPMAEAAGMGPPSKGPPGLPGPVIEGEPPEDLGSQGKMRWEDEARKERFRRIAEAVAGRRARARTARLGLVKARRTFFGRGVLKVLAASSAAWFMADRFNKWWDPGGDADLPEEIRKRSHLIVPGGAQNNRTQVFTRLSGLEDAGGWIGLDDVFGHTEAFNEGRMTGLEVANDMLVQFASEYVGTMGPVKTFFEIATSRSLYPNLWAPLDIKDRAQYGARSLGLGTLYDMARAKMTGEPLISRPGADRQAWTGVRTVMRGEGSYNDALRHARQYLDKREGVDLERGGYTLRSNAFYKYSQSLRAGDGASALFYLGRYAKLSAGMTQVANGMVESVTNNAPLAHMTPDQRRRYLMGLPEVERMRLVRAYQYYIKIYMPEFKPPAFAGDPGIRGLEMIHKASTAYARKHYERVVATGGFKQQQALGEREEFLKTRALEAAAKERERRFAPAGR